MMMYGIDNIINRRIFWNSTTSHMETLIDPPKKAWEKSPFLSNKTKIWDRTVIPGVSHMQLEIYKG